MVKWLRQWCCLLLFFAVPAIADTTSLINKLNQEVLRQQRANRLSALAVSISFPNYYVLNLHAGATQLKSSKALDENSLFQVGSITKSFTAVMVLKLVAENKVGLDKPLTTYLPQYPKWSHITVRELLNHTSGIFNYTSLGSFDHIYHDDHNDTHWEPQEIVNYAYNRPLSFKPGTSWRYSNTNYVLLGMIIHAVTQRPVAENLQKYIFKPYHMNHIYYINNHYPSWIKQHLVHGYYETSDKTDINMSWAGAAGALVSNSEDLAYWGRLLFSGKVLSPREMRELETLVSARTGQPMSWDSNEQGYGLGIKKRYEVGFGDIWYHTGTTTGYSGLYIWVPSRNMAVSVLTSKGDLHYKVRMGIALSMLRMIQRETAAQRLTKEDRVLFQHYS